MSKPILMLSRVRAREDYECYRCGDDIPPGAWCDKSRDLEETEKVYVFCTFCGDKVARDLSEVS